MSFIKDFFRFLVGLAVPVILILFGGLLAGFGITSEYSTLLATGLCIMGAGIIWALFLLYY